MPQNPERPLPADHADPAPASPREGIEAWKPIWAEAGVKFSHHAVSDLLDTRIRLSDPIGMMRGLEIGAVDKSDLVAVRSLDVPNDVNQHLRRVVNRLRNSDDPTRMTAVLGEPIPREEWPAAMRRQTVPMALDVVVRGYDVCLDHGSTTLAVTKATYKDLDATKARFETLLASAARAGKADCQGGREAGFHIVPARDDTGTKTWEIRDDQGRSYSAVRRNSLQRKPPESIEDVLNVVRAAYAHAHSVTRHDDLLASRATTAGGNASRTLYDAASKLVREVNAYIDYHGDKDLELANDALWTAMCTTGSVNAAMAADVIGHVSTVLDYRDDETMQRAVDALSEMLPEPTLAETEAANVVRLSLAAGRLVNMVDRHLDGWDDAEMEAARDALEEGMQDGKAPDPALIDALASEVEAYLAVDEVSYLRRAVDRVRKLLPAASAAPKP